MNEYQIAFTISGGLIIFWVLIYLFCWISQWAWAWIDDSKVDKNNAIISWLMIKNGWKLCDQETGRFSYYKGNRYWDSSSEKSDGIVVLVNTLMISTTFPVFIVIMFNFYDITLFTFAGISIAWLARFARRNKKMFDAHANDPKAHKGN